MIIYIFVDYFKYMNRECRISASFPNRKECGCCNDTGCVVDIVFTDTNERVRGVDIDELEHLSFHPKGWLKCVERAGWKNVDEYHEMLHHKLPSAVLLRDYVDGVLPKEVYLLAKELESK